MSGNFFSSIFRTLLSRGTRRSASQPVVLTRSEATVHVRDPETGTTQTYTDLSQIPPEVREALKKARQTHDSAEAEVEVTREFFVSDGSGGVRSYKSLDEMPPELRELVAWAGRRTG